MNYRVLMLYPDKTREERVFTWWEFESGFMDSEIETFANLAYPNARYKRDGAGVVQFADDKEVVFVMGIQYHDTGKRTEHTQQTH